MRNACDYKEVYPQTGESWAGAGKLLSDVLLQTDYHGAHATERGKKCRTSSSGCLICKEPIYKECYWKEGYDKHT
jgi:hypothetical protein